MTDAKTAELVERLLDSEPDPYFQLTPGVSEWLRTNWTLREEAADRLEAQAKEIVELRDALKPFAALAGRWPHEEDNLTVDCRLVADPAYEVILGTEDFRAARAVLSQEKSNGE